MPDQSADLAKADIAKQADELARQASQLEESSESIFDNFQTDNRDSDEEQLPLADSLPDPFDISVEAGSNDGIYLPDELKDIFDVLEDKGPGKHSQLQTLDTQSLVSTALSEEKKNQKFKRRWNVRRIWRPI